ncbi:MAG: type II secretion system F family protein [Opitutaceae bacterium]
MLPLKHRAVFCRALALQLAAGAEPVSAAGTAAAALPSRWHPAGERLTTALTRGDSFHGALKAAALLPPSDLALVAIGERSGALDEVLRELADIAEETSALRRQIVSGLALPAFNLVAACFIVPLPRLVARGDTVGYLFAALGPLAILAAAGFGLARMWRHASGRALDRWVRPLPLVGAALQEIDGWRFFRTLALLSRTSHGLIDSVRLAAQTCRSERLRELFTAAANDAEARGAPVGPLIERRNVLPPDVVTEWRTGERTGQLEAAFRRIGTRYGETSRQRLRTLAEWTPRLVYLVVLAVMAWQVLRLAGAYFDSLSRAIGG